ncbi:Lsr2 family DNA-binding protein [Actinomycetospora sp. CA-101289]|uniref:Lsr2 family DNA-binding protein n=1 Tax=Actinomycetospora sp. CA-101289 TaxID=3239893 RepID=UPI003D9811F7
MKAIRDWAKSSGRAVSDRGRLPSNIVEAYDAAHKQAPRTGARQRAVTPSYADSH